MLARWGQEENIEFFYAAGAHGPATASWVASRILQVPFAFGVRAQDIAEPGLNWAAKGADAVFVRCDTEATRDAMLQLLPELKDKLMVLRDPLTLTPPDEPEEQMPAPKGDRQDGVEDAADINLLAVGTIARRKGYDLLLRACRLLADRK